MRIYLIRFPNNTPRYMRSTRTPQPVPVPESLLSLRVPSNPSDHPQPPHLPFQLRLPRTPRTLLALAPHAPIPRGPHPLPLTPTFTISSRPIHPPHFHFTPIITPSIPRAISSDIIVAASTEPPQIPKYPQPEENAQCHDVVEYEREGGGCEPVRPSGERPGGRGVEGCGVLVVCKRAGVVVVFRG